MSNTFALAMAAISLKSLPFPLPPPASLLQFRSKLFPKSWSFSSHPLPFIFHTTSRVIFLKFKSVLSLFPFLFPLFFNFLTKALWQFLSLLKRNNVRMIFFIKIKQNTEFLRFQHHLRNSKKHPGLTIPQFQILFSVSLS